MKKAVAISLLIFILLVAAILVFGFYQSSNQGTIYQQNKNLAVKDSSQAAQTSSTSAATSAQTGQSTDTQIMQTQSQPAPRPITRAS